MLLWTNRMTGSSHSQPSKDLARLRKRAERRIGHCVAERYELVELLGVGGYGAVYEAHHRFTDRRVALKLLHDKLADRDDVAARFMLEARAVGALQHPNIPDILDAGVERGRPYVVLEYLDGETLNARMSRASMPLVELIDIFSQLFEALAEAHSRGIVHRDVKPANIFLVKEHGKTRVKLLDFGVARWLTPVDGRELTAVGQVVGTPHYMAPEQIMGCPPDARSDLWSTGVLMYRCLTGRFPHLEAQEDDLYAKIMNPRIVPLKRLVRGLPQELVRLVEACLQPDVSRRLRCAEDGRMRSQALRTRLMDRVSVRTNALPKVAHPAFVRDRSKQNEARASGLSGPTTPPGSVWEEPQTTPEEVSVASRRSAAFVPHARKRGPSWEVALQSIEYETQVRSRGRERATAEQRAGFLGRMLRWGATAGAARGAA